MGVSLKKSWLGIPEKNKYVNSVHTENTNNSENKRTFYYI